MEAIWILLIASISAFFIVATVIKIVYAIIGVILLGD